MIILKMNSVSRQGGIKAGPAATRIELGIRVKQLLPAPGADIRPRLEKSIELIIEWRFGPFIAEDVILLRCQELSPLVFAAIDVLIHVFLE